MKSIVLTIRGSWSMSDVFTDLSALPQEFHADGFPDNTYAHYGAAKCCEKILNKLTKDDMLDKIFDLYPGFDLVITGHSLGAGIGILLGAKLRSKYKNLKVFGYGTPSGLLTREAARMTEQFAFTTVIGDDWVARLSIESIENIKIGVLETLQSCRLPKYRVILNGLQYTLLGIPTQHLEKTWYNVNEASSQSNHSSVLLNPEIISTITNVS
jgi:sn1-specific diacylglycerol lipase